MSLFFLASSVSAQDRTAYYEVGASEGVWVESEWDDNLAAQPEPGYQTESPYASEVATMPTHDPATALQQTESSVEMSYETYRAYGDDSWTESSEAAYTVVKNKNFFGIDRESCCDEWANFSKLCGGLKAKRGHFGIPWLRSGDAGEDCDYQQGGCVEKGRSGCRQKREARKSKCTDGRSKSERGLGEQHDKYHRPEEAGCSSCQ